MTDSGGLREPHTLAICENVHGFAFRKIIFIFLLTKMRFPVSRRNVVELNEVSGYELRRRTETRTRRTLWRLAITGRSGAAKDFPEEFSSNGLHLKATRSCVR